jgi:ferredoxin
MTVKVTVDHELCTGHARCFALAPEVFSIDDEGYCSFSEKVVDDTLAAAAERGASVCPEGAIKVEPA